jgi:hypothetical protein
MNAVEAARSLSLSLRRFLEAKALKRFAIRDLYPVWCWHWVSIELVKIPDNDAPSASVSGKRTQFDDRKTTS